MHRLITVVLAAIALVAISSGAHAATIAAKDGQFTANNKPVKVFYCEPGGRGKHPAVILLHGAAPKGAGIDDFKKMCSDLAEHGFYAMYLEYYSQTTDVSPAELDKMAQLFPTWMTELDAGVGTLNTNDKVDSSKIALVGFSLGGSLALTEGAADAGEITCVVDYYGGVAPQLMQGIGASVMPPVLILHGEKDSLVPVQQAKDLDALLTQKQRPHEMQLYPGVDHAFNFPEFAQWYNEAAAKDAWQRTLKFLDKNLKR